MAETTTDASPFRKTGSGLLARLFALLRRKRPPMGRLDLETMPDRVKRDLGFLDGRDPRHADGRRW